MTKPLPAVLILGMWWLGISKKINGLARWAMLVISLVGAVNSRLRAQDPTNNYCLNLKEAVAGGFTLDKTKICLGDVVKINSGSTPQGLGAIGYFDNYDGKGIPSTTPISPSANLTFTYTNPGSYTILQIGNLNGKVAVACKVVTVSPVDPVKFSVVQCSGRKVIVTASLDASTGQYDSYVIHWGDGLNSAPLSRAEIVTPQSHTYANTTSYSIYITGSYTAAGCGTPLAAAIANQQTVKITATPAAPIITTLTTTGDNTISIQYQATAGSSPLLLQKDAAGIYASTQQIGSNTGSGTFTVQTDAKQVQCFQLAYQDPPGCDNTNSSLKSDQVCSLVLDTKATNKQNSVTWQPYGGSGTFRSYRLFRNGTPIGGLYTNRTTSSYIDGSVECGVQYCYSLVATVGPTTITSAPSCVTGINDNTPGSFGNTVVSIEDNHPRLVTTLPVSGTSNSFTIIVSRATGSSGTFQPIGTTNRNTYIDQTADVTADSYCYQLTYQSSCGLTSAPSASVCTVLLSSKSADGVDWTTASPFAPGSVGAYTLEIVDSVNNTRKEILLGGNTHYTPDPNDPTLQSQRYRVIAVSTSGVVSYSNFFTFRRDPKILVPDAFTPNGDNMNDQFLVKGLYVDQFRMIIYSRWGEVVFSSTDKTKGWDGMIQGQPALEGQYMYRIEIEDLTGQKTVRTGAVLLLR